MRHCQSPTRGYGGSGSLEPKGPRQVWREAPQELDMQLSSEMTVARACVCLCRSCARLPGSATCR
eukprot:4406688-Lingulodinium_polyedra.AAC.1